MDIFKSSPLSLLGTFQNMLAGYGPYLADQRVIMCIVLLFLTLYFFLPARLWLPKLKLACYCQLYFLFSRDRSWKKPVDAGNWQGEKSVSKTIVFVRHGESAWNEVFNKGKNLKFFYRLFRALWVEFTLFASQDSWFVDSPLNDQGIEQARNMMLWLESTEATGTPVDNLLPVLRGDSGNSILVVSNLRRAISTMLIGFGSRLLRSQSERVYMNSNAQEISRNIDTLSVTPADQPPLPSFVERQHHKSLDHVLHFYDAAYSRFDVTQNAGSKGVLGQNGMDRMKAFVHWVFHGTECAKKETVIVAGHSLWFREFLRTYLPTSCDHVGKTSKIVNAGIIAFTLHKGPGGAWIDPQSILEVYGGFEEKKKA